VRGGGGVQQIRLRKEGREKRDLGAVAPSHGFRSIYNPVRLCQTFGMSRVVTDVFSKELGIRLSFVKTSEFGGGGGGVQPTVHQQGVVTCYRLDGLGFEFRSSLGIFFFPKPSRAVLGPTQQSIQWVPAFFPGRKSAGA
jgi:hypothetical protein